MLHTQVTHLQQGCPTAFAELYTHYHRRIFWFGKRMIHDDFVIETLVQDAFLKLWVNRARIESPKHIHFFLRLVMKRSCISYYTTPRNRFFRKVNSLEGYDNYQDYLAGYDPNNDIEHRNAQEKEQQRFERVKKVLPLLNDESSRLIALCLHYDFAYAAIAKCMGTGVTATRNKVKKAIDAMRVILQQEGALELEVSTIKAADEQQGLSREQAAVLHLRCEEHRSFAAIATQLQLTEKEVQRAFVTGYRVIESVSW